MELEKQQLEEERAKFKAEQLNMSRELVILKSNMEQKDQELNTQVEVLRSEKRKVGVRRNPVIMPEDSHSCHTLSTICVSYKNLI